MDNKIIYRAQYLGKSIKHSNGNVLLLSNLTSDISEPIILRNLKDLTDLELVTLNNIAHQFEEGSYKNMEITRDKSMIYIKNRTKDEIYYNTNIDTDYCSIFTEVEIKPIDGDENDCHSYETSIGRIHISARRPAPYHRIIGFLIEHGYLIPWNNMTIKELIEQKFAKFL